MGAFLPGGRLQRSLWNIRKPLNIHGRNHRAGGGGVGDGGRHRAPAEKDEEAAARAGEIR